MATQPANQPTPTGTNPSPNTPAFFSPTNQERITQDTLRANPSGNVLNQALSPAFSSIGHAVDTAATDVGSAYQAIKDKIDPQIGTTSVTPQTTAEIAKLQAGKKSTSTTTPTSIYSGGTGQNALQGMLNKSLSPYLSQLSQSINQQMNTNLVQPWMPDNIKAPIARFQSLTNQGLPGIQKAITSASKDYVASSAANQVLNILPSSLIYHTIVGSLPSFQNQPGLQSLWQILQNTNLGLPNPAQATNSTIEGYLNALTPGGTGTGAATTTSTGTGSTG